MKANQTPTPTSTRTRLVVLFALLLLSGIKMTAQTAQPVIVVPTTITVASVETAAADVSTLKFVSWFMGTKQNTNAAPATEVSESNKKQMINSGIAPNRLLLKAFLKRASSFASTVA